MPVQFFQTRLQYFCIGIIKYFCRVGVCSEFSGLFVVLLDEVPFELPVKVPVKVPVKLEVIGMHSCGVSLL